ncbi:ribosomal protein S5 domain 2-like protein [Ramicandelaber brevisporus]|nr:ribosomal protein S5 domain 2-like protein [Ramicandelaber brevisporus]
MTTRLDNRSPQSLRPLYAAQGLLYRSDGSGRFDLGRTSVLCSVNGPMEVRLRDELYNRAALEINHRPATGTPSTADRFVEHNIRHIVNGCVLSEQYPRSLVQVNLQVRCDDGCTFAAAVNSAMLALLDAGIAMRTVVAAVTCLVLGSNKGESQIVLDPTAEEIENCRRDPSSGGSSVHTFVFESAAAKETGSIDNNRIAFNESRGVYSMEQYQAAAEACRTAAERIHAFMRTAIENRIKHTHQV